MSGAVAERGMAEEGNRPKGVSPLAGKPATKDMLIDVAKLERDYFERRPDVHDPNQLVSFGTSGHRGTPFKATFTEAHILAITQAICEYRHSKGINGPLYMGKDTHAVSGPAQRTALEVLAANSVETIIQQDDGVTPTPVISPILLAMAVSNTIRPTVAPRTPTSLAGFKIARMIFFAVATKKSSARRMNPPSKPAPPTKKISSSPTSTICATS
jgi:hypothetical protein